MQRMRNHATDRRALPLVALAGMAAVLWGLTPAASMGASPPPSPAAGPTVGPEAWLDRPAPSAGDAPGTLVTVGFTLWDPVGGALLSGTFPYVRLQPLGGGSPTEADAAETWRGHFAASLVIPAGGVGDLEIGAGGTACDSNGCRPADTAFRIAGVGPPPDAPLPAIATASIVRPPDVVRAGSPVAIGVRLVPNAAWDPASFPMPDALYLGVGVARGRALDPVAVPLVDAGTGAYRVSVTFPEPGDYTLRVSTAAQPARDDQFATALITVSVEPSGGAPPDAAPDGGPGGGVDPLVVGGLALAAAVVVAVVVGGAITRRRR